MWTQVVSGDVIVVRDKPKDDPPNEKTLILMSIAAPKLGRKTRDGEEKDEPFAWEAREYLRKKLIGQEVYFYAKPFPDSKTSNRMLGRVFFPTKEKDIAEELVANGLAKVKKEKTTKKQAQDPYMKKLIELEEKAKAEGKGIWSKNKEKAVRNVKYVREFNDSLVEFKKNPVNAIIETVRDVKKVVMLDVMLLPTFHSIPFAISGIKFSDETFNYQEEAKFFIEARLLQQDVQIVIEKEMNKYAVGSILHPKGNIAELLLKEGFVCCDDRTISLAVGGFSELRAAEKFAKERRIRSWKSYENNEDDKKKKFQGIVTEIVGGDALIVKIPKTGEMKKIFLSSIIPPRKEKDESKEITSKDKPRVTMYDVPLLFEAREFLRKKLIGKKVQVVVDYTQEARDTYPEKLCCTVTVGGNNIAEALVQNGLAKVVKHRAKDERSSFYDALCAAEREAEENGKGIHSKTDGPKHKINDCTNGSKAEGIFPILQKADRIEGVVEYVMSGSRMRIYIPKDLLMITFLLSGISCPRASMKAANRSSQPAEPFGEEALNFTKEKVLQRAVVIRIESLRKGSMLGTLMINNTNLALALVSEGLAKVHSSCSDRALIQAQKIAVEAKKGVWQNKQEEQRDENREDVSERKLNYIDVSVVCVSSQLHIYAHHLSEKKALEELQKNLQGEFVNNPSVCYSKERPPQKGELIAAKFSDDQQWYRAKTEINCKDSMSMFFIDYGNSECVTFENLAPLPNAYRSPKPFVHEYGLACVRIPQKQFISDDYINEVNAELFYELADRKLRINVEYYVSNLAYVSIVDAETNEDCIKTCIEKGMFYAEYRKEKKLESLVKEYKEAERKAKKNRVFVWKYGDARDDDAEEFGMGN